ncbi:unnamed protein product [Clonostachys byssicola]|uniref:Uncharacterized protein n=1 Tax=Clonostachys byssicola TaxID=160290 RepID=A0A9N9UEZ7_9HYPO|nr:unnamed protein product [Clonostachys byssicola]
MATDSCLSRSFLFKIEHSALSLGGLRVPSHFFAGEGFLFSSCLPFQKDQEQHRAKLGFCSALVFPSKKNKSNPDQEEYL